MNHMFITIEGIDGSGKTTQITALKERLTANNYNVTLTREPGGTELGDYIRNYLLQSGKKSPPFPMTALLLFIAARYEHIMCVIKPSLDAGMVVICDRFIDSTIAYQGYGLGLDIKSIKLLHEIAFSTIEKKYYTPDLTFILEIDVKTSLSRQAVDSVVEYSGYDAQKIEMYRRMILGFCEIAKENNERCRVLNGLVDADDISDMILDTILSSKLN